jgi:hypothetical protein
MVSGWYILDLASWLISWEKVHCDMKTWGFITIKKFKQKECGNECCDMHKMNLNLVNILSITLVCVWMGEKNYAMLKYTQSIGIKIMGI